MLDRHRFGTLGVFSFACGLCVLVVVLGWLRGWVVCVGCRVYEILQ